MKLAFHAEWTKLRTIPGTYWLLLAIVTATVSVSVAAVNAVSGDTADPTKTSLTGVYLGQAVVAVLGVLTMSGEYGTGMVRITLSAIPNRITLLAAKAAALTGLVATAATIAVIGSLIAGRLVLPGGPVLRAGAGTILYLVLIGLLSIGVAAAVRDSASAIGVVLGLLYVWPIITAAVPDRDLQEDLQQIGPMNAGLAVQVTENVSSLPIGPWQGLGVLSLWAAAALLAGGLLLRVRDA